MSLRGAMFPLNDVLEVYIVNEVRLRVGYLRLARRLPKRAVYRPSCSWGLIIHNQDVILSVDRALYLLINLLLLLRLILYTMGVYETHELRRHSNLRIVSCLSCVYTLYLSRRVSRTCYRWGEVWELTASSIEVSICYRRVLLVSAHSCSRSLGTLLSQLWIFFVILIWDLTWLDLLSPLQEVDTANHYCRLKVVVEVLMTLFLLF